MTVERPLDDEGERMTGAMQYIFLELPNCARAFTEEASELDDFCFSIRNMETFEERPASAQKSELLSCLFDSAEIANFTAEERTKYINDMTTKRDIINQIAYAKKEGLAEGEAKVAAEKMAIARNLKNRRMDIAEIAEITSLSIETVESL